MKKTILKALTALALISPNINAFANVSLPKLVSDNMVLQRGKPIMIWGYADNGENVSVTFDGVTLSTVASADGKWSVTFPKKTAQGPYEIKIKGNNEITVKNVLVGDVYLCSGQSNMELPIRRVEVNYPGVVEASENNLIRYFEVPKNYNFSGPQDDMKSGEWKLTNPGTVREFSSFCYFFAKRLVDETNVPVGIINAALGGSPIEAWLCEDDLKQFPAHYKQYQFMSRPGVVDSIDNDNKTKSANWYSAVENKDLGKPNHWESLSDYSDWKPVTIPDVFRVYDPTMKSGVAWFSRKVTLTKEQAENAEMIIMGVIVDSDIVYVNGKQVGTTGYQYPPRRYALPAGTFHEGENTIVVRVRVDNGHGEFVNGKKYIIQTKTDTVDVSGEWRYKKGCDMENAPREFFIRWQEGGLYNGLIGPLKNVNINGVVWYQGESNAGREKEYEVALGLLIDHYRKFFNNPKLPVAVVQLPKFMAAKDEPSEGSWADMRLVQFKACKEHHAMVVNSIDLGEWNDIHPLNKKDQGDRTANLFLRKKDAAFAQIKFASFKENAIILTFTDVIGELKTTDGKAPQEFAVAGDDGKYYWAKAEIIAKNKVKLTCTKVSNPKSIRYLHANNPSKCNLVSSNGLPVFPFDITLK